MALATAGSGRAIRTALRTDRVRTAAGRNMPSEPKVLTMVIKNGIYAATISQTGAELKSLADMSSGKEYIWHGDPAWWNGSAPVLFPIVGGLRDGAYTFEGGTYKLGNHGFARASEFSIVREGTDSAELALSSSAKTKESYPFDFRLAVEFSLKRTGMSIRYTVTNTGSRRMYFSIGSHPAFVVPFAGGALENYYVIFDQDESNERWFIKDNLVVADKTEEVFENGRIISISRTLFDQGALVFKHPRSREFTIKNSLNPRFLKVVTEGAPYLGIWGKPGGPFVCVEPWHGVADATNASGDLAAKEGILSLEPRGAFNTGYRIEIG
jgi:galactose mutarotase-like enzyme